MKINFYRGDLPASFKATDIVALDSETMGLNPKRDKLCLVQISNGDEICHLVKINLSNEKPINLIKHLIFYKWNTTNLRTGANIILYVLVLIAEKNSNIKCGICGNVLINLNSDLLFGLKRLTLGSLT